MSEKTIEELNNFIQTLPELSMGERLKQAEFLAKDKEKAIEWIENLIFILREHMLNNYSSSDLMESRSQNPTSSQQARTIKSFQKLHILLKTTNINPRFAIEHTLLSL